MQWFLFWLELAFVYWLYTLVEGYKIRFGRERSRILKLRKRKSAFVDRLNLLTKTRGVGIFTLQATSEDQTQSEDSSKTETSTESFDSFLPKKKKKREPKNPVVKRDIDKFEPLFRKIPALRYVKKEVTRDQRPGALNPLGYAAHYVTDGDWRFHPSLIRVRGKYFSRLYEKELRDPFKMHEHDTGSAQVQVASLTAKLDYLSLHFKRNPKDIQARLQILRLGNRRRRLLGYLYRTNRPEFDSLVETFQIDFEDAPLSDKKLLPQYTHIHHKKTKRYTSAKEQRTATRQHIISTANQEVF
ncbi:putative 30S ribosomal protein S15 [Babesia bovis T2Bo]|uniref:30S ribosomal protein S15 n=1 Tax=Babesia bovis TaxID=5865 RepID=A7AP20_BABBO|nr:putative 30S ribosomal protein S15 [Babesia bovis T2Bo]EDO08304.1 putative 30S ribosomal protein S15 [Babesia bovis T2Bo]|eukprot:XP_001611872.1 30S ribosomal protein S15 [Babesia bovis T2Bo]